MAQYLTTRQLQHWTRRFDNHYEYCVEEEDSNQSKTRDMERSTRCQVTSVQTVTVMIQFTQKQLQLSRWRSWWRGWDDCKIVMTRRIRPGGSSGGGGEQFVSRHPATPLLTTPHHSNTRA